MTIRCFGLCVAILSLALSVCGQGTTDADGVNHPSEEEIAANKRWFELLRHPTFITLRLVSIPYRGSREQPSDNPPPYTAGERILFRLSLSQALSDTIFVDKTASRYYEFRLKLYKDGDIVPYSKPAQAQFERTEKQLWEGSVSSQRLVPNLEEQWASVNLDDWYEPLGIGHYQLTVGKRFVWDGDWAESNPVTFDVIPRKLAAPIPDGLKVRLVPEGSKPQPKGQMYRLGNEVDVAAVLVNDSDQRVRVSVIDRYYGHRLQLYKDGKLIPYTEETTKLIESKDANPRLVEIVPDFFLDPKTTSQLDGLSLKKWYGPLTPGLYRLIDRRRFEIDGPWTKDSAELIFEVVPQE